MRASKEFDDVVSGHVKIGMYEKQKKRSQPNRKGGISAEAEGEAAETATRLLSILMPVILTKLSTADDPRSTKMAMHALPTLILYGILMFLFNIPFLASQCASRLHSRIPKPYPCLYFNPKIFHNVLTSLR